MRAMPSPTSRTRPTSPAVHGAVSLQIAKQNDPWIDWKPLKKRVSLMIDAVIRGIERE